MAATNPPPDPRAAVWRPGDSWVSIGKPITGVGAVKVRMNQEYLFFEKGALRTDAQQIPLAMIIDVDAKQTMTQKARGVGSVFVHVQRPNGAREVAVLDDLPDFRDGVARINDASRQARFHAHTMQNTQHINYHGAPPVPVAQPSVQSALPSSGRTSPDEIFAQIERLGELRDKGFITGEDFDQKKADLLSRL
jgi:hypothetical protein